MIIYLAVILVLVMIDRALKVFMTVYLADIPEKSFIKGFMKLTFTKNTGASFGMLRNHTLFLTIITSVFVLVMLYVIVSKRTTSKLMNTALILITAGGIGNLYDRIVYGYVVDYFEFTFVNYAVFNFADVLINIGAVILFVYLIFIDRGFLQKKNKLDDLQDIPEAVKETETDG